MAKKKRRNARPPVQTEKQPADKKAMYANIARLGCLIIVTAAVFFSYRALIGFYFFEITLVIYMVLATVAILAYVIYNRGFSRRGVTEDMLPDNWSKEKKREYIEDGNKRYERSKWMLSVIIPLMIPIALDAISLFTWPIIQNLLGLK